MADSLQLPPLVELILNNGFIDEEQAQTLVRDHLTQGKPDKELILALEILGEEDLLSMMAGEQGTDVIDVKSVAFDEALKNLIPVASVRLHTLVPVEVSADCAIFATADLVETDVIDELTFLLSREIRFVFAPEADIKAVIDEHFSASEASDALIEDLSEMDGLEGEADEKGIESAAASAPVIRFVNLVLYQAITDRAFSNLLDFIRPGRTEREIAAYLQYLMLKAVGALCAGFELKRSAGLIEDFAAAMGILLAMTGTVLVLLLVSTVCFMKAVA